MGIYTKSGDTGLASTMTRRRVPKDSPIFRVLGTLDEATSQLGLAKQYLSDEAKLVVESIQKDINGVSGELAGAGAYVDAQKITQLETAIDSIMGSIPEVKLFVIPGKTFAGAHLDVARTIIRRAEREAVSASQNGGVSRDLMAWINRLSDMVYALARMADAVGDVKTHKCSCSCKETSVKKEEAPPMEPITVGSDNFFEKADIVCRKVIEKARSEGLSAVVAICDSGTNLVCLNRDDDAFIASIDIAINKAYTSSSLKMTTKKVGELSAEGEGLHGLQYTNQGRIVIFGGGIPLYYNGKIAGAIGVSGGSAEQDEALAQYGEQVFASIK